ncbi:hypothetical protein D3C85_1181180 [compost metagenome]
MATLDGANQFAFVDLARGSIFGDVFAHQLQFGELHQQIDSQNSFPGARSTFDDHHLGGLVRGLACRRQRRLKNCFLIVNQYELGFAFHQPPEGFG